MSKVIACRELGVCADRVPACPDCPERNKIKLRATSRFTDRPGCAREAYPQPTYPFAPSVIQRQPIGATGEFCSASNGFPLSLADAVKVVAVVLMLIAAGLAVGGAE